MNRVFLTAATFFIAAPMAAAFTYKVVDVHGNTVIPPLYENINAGVGYLELVKPKTDSTPPKFGRFGQVHETETITVDLNGKKINRPVVDRTKVLPAEYTSVFEQFGYLFARSPAGAGVFSRTGRELIPAQYTDIEYHGDGLFIARKMEDSMRYFLLTDNGRLICELPSWIRPGARRFKEGLLNISDSMDPSKFLDKHGKIRDIGNNLYREIGDFKDGIATANYTENNEWYGCYIDKSGKMVLGPYKYCSCSPFARGFAVILERKPEAKNRYGLLSRSGKFVIPIGTYDSLAPTYNGTWLSASNSKGFYLLHSDGKEFSKFPDGCKQIFEPLKYTDHALIGFAVEKSQGKDVPPRLVWGYCDVFGKVVIEPKFVSCQPFDGELAVVSLGEDEKKRRVGVINRRGEWVVQPRYNWLSIASPNRFIVTDELAEEKKTENKKTFQNALSSRDRGELFLEFLKEHNLIGMSKQDVEAALGLPLSVEGLVRAKDEDPVICYPLTSGGFCGNSYSAIEIRLNSDGKVDGWRHGEFMAPRGMYFITEDVVPISMSGGFGLGNLVPKK